MKPDSLEIKILNKIQNIRKEDWAHLESDHFPFLDYEFLLALEQENCLGARTGWFPAFVGLYKANQLVAANPLFMKTNSYGEYIFDWAWANAYAEYGHSYYPKLVSAIPFTPATGPKLLRRKDLALDVSALPQSAQTFNQKEGFSSLHYLFVPETEAKVLESVGFAIRHTHQFHWKNDNYLDFNSFLNSLRSKRRKDVRRERTLVSSSGLRILRLTGPDIKSWHSEVFYKFYHSTISKMGAIPYLTKSFFERVFEKMSDKILFVLALNGETPVAGALNFYKGDKLYGRYWGCLEEYAQLHFELCYYQTIEFAIENKIAIFEAGAQGEHKLQRGFLPAITYSAHWIENADFRKAIQGFILQEQEQTKQILSEYLEHTPFSRATQPLETGPFNCR